MTYATATAAIVAAVALTRETGLQFFAQKHGGRYFVAQVER